MTNEYSLIDLAALVLAEEKRPYDIYELYQIVTKKAGLSEEEKDLYLNKFYTDLTLSAKFIYVGENQWNLKANEKVELWEKDGSFYKEYNTVELPEEYKTAPYETKKKPKAVKQEEQVEPVVEPVEPTVHPKEEVVEEVKEPTVEPVVEPVESVEEKIQQETLFDDEFEEDFDDYDDFDEEKYNEYMDTYEDQYDD
jgi:DNA-directed RNA polymerase subunit delta